LLFDSEDLRQKPQGVYYLNVHFLVSFPQAMRACRQAGLNLEKIPDKPNDKIWAVAETTGCNNYQSRQFK
jgi:hypothetical protein